MKILSFAALLAVVGALIGCGGSPVYYHRDPSRQIVVLDQREISIISLGNDKWEAFGGKQRGSSDADRAKQKSRQIEAIEKVTDCRVVSTEFPEKNNSDLLLIHAIVNCAEQTVRSEPGR